MQNMGRRGAVPRQDPSSILELEWNDGKNVEMRWDEGESRSPCISSTCISRT